MGEDSPFTAIGIHSVLQLLFVLTNEMTVTEDALDAIDITLSNVFLLNYPVNQRNRQSK